MEPDISLPAQAETYLARWSMRLAFPPELEARYRRDRAAERSREQRAVFRIGLFLYVAIGVLMKLAGVTHITWPDCLLQLGGAALVSMLMIYFCFRPKISDEARESAALVCCLITSLAAILVTFSKPATLQDLIIAALPVNFVLMFVRLRFAYASIYALVTFAVYVATILLQPLLAPPQQAFLATFMAILCLPALIGVHTLERATRRLYLHGFLQRTRLTHIEAENITLSELSLTDPLTQTTNRRGLDRDLQAFCAAKSLGGALLLIDIDGFKSFNDRHGHPAGDMCLQQIAKCLSAHLRRHDVLARYGGEEFAVLLPDVTAAEAATMAERLRTAVETYPIMVKNQLVGVTVSIGVASRDAYKTPNLLIETADIALYTAKATGRNKVHEAVG